MYKWPPHGTGLQKIAQNGYIKNQYRKTTDPSVTTTEVIERRYWEDCDA